jgi:choline dehydrogenase-like flavoprotein
VTPSRSVECGAVVIGSGAGGATMAAELAEVGIDVVLIEEGGYHRTETFGPESLRALRTLYRDGGGGMTLGRPSVLYAEGRCVGGSTVVNGGMSWRTPPRILADWASDVRAVTERDMEPYFDEVEKRLHVALQDPGTVGRDSELLKAGAEALGWRIVPNRRNQLHCAGTNNCNSGCPTGAKQSMLVTNVPRALAAGARLYANCKVTRVTESGVLAWWSGSDDLASAAQLEVRARVVVVAGGAIQTPALLRRSGITSPSGQLGRNLALHPNANVIAFFDEEVTGWHGVHQAFQIREFMSDGIIVTANNLAPPMLAAMMPAHGRELGELMAAYNNVVTAGPLIEDTGTGSVRVLPGVGPQVFYRLTDRDADRVTRGVELTAETMFAAGARRVILPFDGVPSASTLAEAKGVIAHASQRRGAKRLMRLYSIHLMGTARMSEDPRRGVVNSFGEFHGRPGLFISDASLFPTPTGLNPMETIVALSLRNARNLIEHRHQYSL